MASRSCDDANDKIQVVKKSFLIVDGGAHIWLEGGWEWGAVVIRRCQNVNKTSVSSWQGARRAVAACWYVSNLANSDFFILHHQ